MRSDWPFVVILNSDIIFAKYHLTCHSKYHMNTDDKGKVHSSSCVPSASVRSRETEGHVRGRAVHQSVCGKRSWDPYPGRPAQRRPAQNTGRRLHQLVSSHTEKSQWSRIIVSPAAQRSTASTAHVTSVAVLFCHICFFCIASSFLIIPGSVSPSRLISRCLSHSK